MKITGSRAIVTGGAMGIGLAAVKRLAGEGCVVSIWDLNSNALADAEKQLSAYAGKIFYCQCDVSDRKRIAVLAEKALKDMGGIDILINNAGIVLPGMVHETDPALHVKTMDINVNALFYTINAVLEGMYRQNFGVIVNISSAAGTLGIPGMASYSAAKWAVWGMTEALRHEAKNLKKNVHFASVHPSYLATGMFEGSAMKGLGSLIVPRVKNHDVIAKAIVNSCIKGRKTVVYRPRSVRLAVLLRGILPDKVLFGFIRLLNVHTSMQSWKGRNNG
ncbi:MAG: SDR family NAD(P)-dependent oxidoreductase [Spirochaetales bacterium]|nr:SDR family NAD(P)-dependent oxidoreductase [Spirochaetales bacterium]